MDHLCGGLCINTDCPQQDDSAPAIDQPPSRPWTPSYSVTRQGSVSDAGADATEEIPAVATEEPATNGTLSSEKAVEPAVETVTEAATNGNSLAPFPTSDEGKKMSAK